MNTYFLTAIRYDKTMESGLVKKMTEYNLVNALSFTEAESRIIEEMRPFMQGEFSVSAVKIFKLSEIFLAEEDKTGIFFKAKLIFLTLDEKTGNEKKTATNILVQASDIRDAIRRIDEGMRGTMADYEISSVAETPIVSVFEYKQPQSSLQ